MVAQKDDIDIRKLLDQRTRELQASEARFRNAINRNADGIIIVDAEGIVRFINPATETLFGRKAEYLLGELFGFPLVAGEITEIDIIRRNNDTGVFEMRVAEMRAVQTEWEGELAYLASLRDITDRKKAEEERAKFIREQTARVEAEAAGRRLAFLAEASAILGSSLNYETTLIRVTKLAVPYLADACVIEIIEDDQSIRQLKVAYRDKSETEPKWEMEGCYRPDPNVSFGPPSVLHTGQSEIYKEVNQSLRQNLLSDSGHLKCLSDYSFRSYMCVPLIARGRSLGTITFVFSESDRYYDRDDLTLAEDLARRLALAVDNARLYREAQDANRIKDEFLATVSHELRTPLTSILGWTKMIRGSKLDKSTASRALEVIERNAKAQAQIIDDLLDVSRIITGKLRLEIRPIKLISIVEAAIDSICPAAEAKEIKLKVFLNPEVGTISGDADRLQQVVWNLLSNAIKFTSNGGIVEVRLDRFDSHVEIKVSDTGKGISTEFLPHVFERFRQADGSITRTYGGLGLGLSIVRHLVELHGGTVQVESCGEGQGAVFTVCLPLSLGQEATRHTTGSRLKPLSNIASVLYERLHGLRVLVVDDEPDTLEFIETVLAEYGAEVKAVMSVAKALQLMENWKPDILVSDIGMPGEDGYSLIGKVRAMKPENGGKMPAVALTAYARAEDRQRALMSGFQMHVTKPIEPDELAAVVASLAKR
jgi:PAS domain S-box-containing protein